MPDAPTLRLTLFERLRWLVETWPERRSFSRAEDYDRWHQRVASGEWLILYAVAATVAGAAGRSGSPEALLAWWLTIYGGAEYARRRQRAIEVLARAQRARRNRDGAPPQTVMQLDTLVMQLDTLVERWLDRFRDFGAAGVFLTEGLTGTEAVLYGATMWREGGARPDFVANAIRLPDGTVIHGAMTVLVADLSAADLPAGGPPPRETESVAPAVDAAPPAPRTPPPRSRERQAPARCRLVAAMQQALDSGALAIGELAAMKDTLLEVTFGGRRTMCREARKIVLAKSAAGRA